MSLATNPSRRNGSLFVQKYMEELWCDLIEVFKVMNGMDNIKNTFIFESDEGGWKGHDDNCSKERLGWS